MPKVFSIHKIHEKKALRLLIVPNTWPQWGSSLSRNLNSDLFKDKLTEKLHKPTSITTCHIWTTQYLPNHGLSKMFTQKNKVRLKEHNKKEMTLTLEERTTAWGSELSGLRTRQCTH